MEHPKDLKLSWCSEQCTATSHFEYFSTELYSTEHYRETCHLRDECACISVATDRQENLFTESGTLIPVAWNDFNLGSWERSTCR